MEENKLNIIRKEIDALDRELAVIIEKRMKLVSLVSEYKIENKLEVLDGGREKKVIENALSVISNPDYTETIKHTFESIMEHSRAYQRVLNVRKDSEKGPEKFALIGEHLSHSLSAVIHDLFFKYSGLSGSYELVEVPGNKLSDILNQLKSKGFKGANVTIPYKSQIMNSINKLSDKAARIGAVNTVKLTDQYEGYNTDYRGFGMSLSYYGFDPKNKSCAVLGSGGASRAVVSYLEDQGAQKIVIVTRDTEAAAVKYPKLTCVRNDEFIANGIDLIVNATPVGMSPNTELSPISKNLLNGAGFVMDLIYNPSVTLLLKYAGQLGIPGANGLYMLVAQAVCSQEIWQDKLYGIDIVNKIYEDMRIS